MTLRRPRKFGIVLLFSVALGLDALLILLIRGVAEILLAFASAILTAKASMMCLEWIVPSVKPLKRMQFKVALIIILLAFGLLILGMLTQRLSW